MFKKLFCIVLCFCILITMVSCDKMMSLIKLHPTFSRYEANEIGPFDTYIRILGYTKLQKEFTEYSDKIIEKIKELDKLYDIYNDYEGINNLKTINDNAGVKPVKVSEDIINLLKFSKDAYKNTKGTLNIAFGPVLSIWHIYRERGLENPALAEAPSMESLKEANKITDIDKIIIDENEKTVFLSEKGMSIDVGAIAKGYAAQVAIDEAKSLGLISCIIDMGGNISTLGKPMDNNHDRWSIGVKNPDEKSKADSDIIDTVYVNDMAIVTSGIYQRYYVVDSVKYHHIIDPATLMPANRYSAVTIICKDSGVADMLSTALFILSYEEAFKLAESYEAAVMWVNLDGSIKTNKAYDEISKKYGNYSATDKVGA